MKLPCTAWRIERSPRGGGGCARALCYLSGLKGNDMKLSGLKLGLMVDAHVRVDWYWLCLSLVATRTNGSDRPLVSIGTTLRALSTCGRRAQWMFSYRVAVAWGT